MIISRYDAPSKFTERVLMLVSFLGLSFGYTFGMFARPMSLPIRYPCAIDEMVVDPCCQKIKTTRSQS